MLPPAPMALVLLALMAGARQASVPPVVVRDTVQAGDRALDASRLGPFSLTRQLTLTKGDTVRPFGTQSEQLSQATLNGQRVWLDVLIFQTPRATTVDSSWTNAQTLEPVRFRSTNRERVVTLDFAGRRVTSHIVPVVGEPTSLDQELPVQPFEWNMFGLAISALPLRPGYRVRMPVYSDRFSSVSWYTVEVVGDTSLTRANGFRAPMWEVLATTDGSGPTARLWISQRHRFVDRALLSEPGIAILYARN